MQGKWEQYKLQEKLIDVEFNPPLAYFEMRKMQIWQQRYSAFSDACSNEMLSKTLLMKNLLKWTNEEIMENIKLRKLEAAHEWELAQIQNAGPMWKQEALAEVTGELGGGGDDMMGGPGGGPGGDFGGPGGGDMGGFDDAGFSDDDIGDMESAADDAGDVLGDAPDE